MSIWIVLLMGGFLCQMPDSVEGNPLLSSQTPRVQALYRKNAMNWIRMGHVLWSIEVKQQAKIKAFAPAKKREPYEQDNAPYYYEPIRKVNAHSLAEIEEKTGKIIKLDQKTSIGKETDQGVQIKLSNRQTILLILDKSEALERLDGYAIAMGKRVPKNPKKTSSSQTIAVYQYYPQETVVQQVTAQELYAYFQHHQLTHFPILRPKKVWDQRKITQKIYVGSGSLKQPRIQTRPEKYHFKWVNYPLRAK